MYCPSEPTTAGQASAGPSATRLPTTAIAVASLTAAVHLELDGFFLEGGIAGLLMLLLALSGAVLVWLGLWARQRPTILRGLVLLAGLVGGTAAGVGIGKAQVRATMARGDRIVAALEAWHGAAGSYPTNLEDLVRGGSAHIPPTAMGLLRTQTFHYERREDSYVLSFDGQVGTGFRRGPRTSWVWFD